MAFAEGPSWGSGHPGSARRREPPSAGLPTPAGSCEPSAGAEPVAIVGMAGRFPGALDRRPVLDRPARRVQSIRFLRAGVAHGGRRVARPTRGWSGPAPSHRNSTASTPSSSGCPPSRPRLRSARRWCCWSARMPRWRTPATTSSRPPRSACSPRPVARSSLDRQPSRPRWPPGCWACAARAWASRPARRARWWPSTWPAPRCWPANANSRWPAGCSSNRRSATATGGSRATN